MPPTLRQRPAAASAAAQQTQHDSDEQPTAASPPARQQRRQQAAAPPAPRQQASGFRLARLASMLAATAMATCLLAARQPGVQQQIQRRLPYPARALALRLGLGPGGQLFSAAQLSGLASDGGSRLYIAILGQVFDVSSRPDFYGADGGYGHFVGTDGSLSFITGDFSGDVTDDVSSLDGPGCLGLLGWLDFYLNTYPFVGRRVGAFYDASGRPTVALASVYARAAQGQQQKADEEDEVARWPNCNNKWSEAEGGRVWCDGGRYPRRLYVNMVKGKPAWRCACFAELGWSDVRQVYPECEPGAHSCSTDYQTEETLAAADEAVRKLVAAMGG